LGFKMLDKILFDQTNIPTLLKSLDATMLRARTIANNVANVNTPGYQRLEVSFEEELRRSLDNNRLKGTRTQEGHMALGAKNVSKINPQVERPIDPTLPSGVNNVDIDSEMAKMAENQILYNFSSKMLITSLRKINSAIQAKSMPIQ
jgi:flagellar basal-body rod protein FlgB